MLTPLSLNGALRTTRTTQKVVVVNGSEEMLELLESVLDAGHYDVVFIAEAAHAYSEIRRSRPNLVILCVGLDEPLGFQVLSMLKLDEETADIPVLTYANELECEPEAWQADRQFVDEGLPLPSRRELPMN